VVAAQAAWAVRAVLTACCTSSARERATRLCTSPVSGLCFGNVSPPCAASSSPPMWFVTVRVVGGAAGVLMR
jgi:hypothetical protein